MLRRRRRLVLSEHDRVLLMMCVRHELDNTSPGMIKKVCDLERLKARLA